MSEGGGREEEERKGVKGKERYGKGERKKEGEGGEGNGEGGWRNRQEF